MPPKIPSGRLIATTHRLGRFLSKDPAEAENPTVDQQVANIQMIGDYDAVPTKFYLKPPEGLIYEIWRVLILIRDNSTLSSDSYVSGGALTNGINFTIENGEILTANTIPIKQISDYASYAGVDVKPLDLSQSKAWAVRWTIQKAGAPLYLQGNLNESLNVNLTDDFDTLTGHTALVQGMIWNA